MGSNPDTVGAGRWTVVSGKKDRGRRLERSGEEGRTNLTQSRRVNRGVAERMPDEEKLTIGDGAWQPHGMVACQYQLVK